jgi:hypothetical protein
LRAVVVDTDIDAVELDLARGQLPLRVEHRLEDTPPPR